MGNILKREQISLRPVPGLYIDSAKRAENVPLWCRQWNTEVCRNAKVADGQIAANGRVTRRITNDKSLTPDHHVLTERMREWCFTNLGPWFWQPTLTLEKLPISIDQGDE